MMKTCRWVLATFVLLLAAAVASGGWEGVSARDFGRLILVSEELSQGAEGGNGEWSRAWERVLEAMEGLRRQLDGLAEELQRIPESEKFKELKQEFDRLVEEIKRAERDARAKIQQDVLPRLREELDRLREELRRLLDEEEEPQSIPT